ncbi:MAG TPA: HD domain-containing phosphohydrolase, partial [Candidatus Obscuribacter sp.]|nr:HD domain-containing phosphohydrolase [Candidatus Obscuribacter sp.]
LAVEAIKADPGDAALKALGGAAMGIALSLQPKTRLPQLVMEVAGLANTLALVSTVAAGSDQITTAYKNAWQSEANYYQSKSQLTGTVKDVLATSIPMTVGGSLGAIGWRTVPVYHKENLLLKKLEAHHPESAEHSLRVAKLAELTAGRMKIPAWQGHEAFHGGKMHDVGKCCINRAILDSPNELTAIEQAIMRAHPIESKNMLQSVPYRGALKEVPEVAGSHHEHFDGSGYPLGLKGSEIRSSTQALAVVDVVDAVTYGRHYSRGGRNFGERLSLKDLDTLLQNGKGKHFSPDAVDAFMQVRARDFLKVIESAPGRPPLTAAELRPMKGTTVGDILKLTKSEGNLQQTAAYHSFKAIYERPNQVR